MTAELPGYASHVGFTACWSCEMSVFKIVDMLFQSLVTNRAELAAENVALRKQLAIP